MKIEITPEQRLLMIHALDALDLAISHINEQLRRATPKNMRFGQLIRFSPNGEFGSLSPLKPNEPRYPLVDENDKECHTVPKKLAKLMSTGVLEQLGEYEELRYDLVKLSETPNVIRAYNKTEQDELK